MTKIADVLSVRDQFARSANLERDADLAGPLDGYVVTARALDVVERVTSAVVGPAGGAWSITGPIRLRQVVARPASRRCLRSCRQGTREGAEEDLRHIDRHCGRPPTGVVATPESHTRFLPSARHCRS